MAKLVFITGASCGMGQALALVARRTDEIEAWATRNKIYPDRYQIYSADVAQARKARQEAA